MEETIAYKGYCITKEMGVYWFGLIGCLDDNGEQLFDNYCKTLDEVKAFIDAEEEKAFKKG